MARLSVVLNLVGQDTYRSQIAAVGASGEQASQRITTGFTKTEAQIVRMIQQTQGFQRQLDQMAGAGNWDRQASGLLLTGEAARSAAAGMNNLDDAHKRAAGHADENAFAIGRGIRAMEGMSVAAFGLNHHLTTMTVLLAEMGAGHEAVFGLVTVIGLLGFAYEKLTEDTREQVKAQNELTTSAEAWYKVERLGIAGERTAQLDAELKKQHDLQQKLTGIQQALSAGPTDAMGNALTFDPDAAAKITKELGKTNDIIAALQKARNEELQQAIVDRSSLYDRDLANLIASGHSTRQEINTALLLIADYEKQLSYLATLHPEDREQADQIQRLRSNLLSNLGTLRTGIAGFFQNLDEQFKSSGGFPHFGEQLDAVAEHAQKLQATMIPLSRTIQEAGNIQKFLNDHLKETVELGKRNQDITRAQTNATADQIRAVDKLQSELGMGLLGIVEQAATHGIQSWGQFLGEIENKTLDAVRKINEELAKPTTTLQSQIDRLTQLRALATAVNIGATAIGGGIQAFDVGRSAGSSGSAILGGAASGAATGAAIGSTIAPGIGTAVGAAVGAIDGAVIALFGHAQKLKDLRREFETNEQKYIDSLTSYSSSYAQSFAGIEKAFQDLDAAARGAHTSVSAQAAAAKDAAEQKIITDFITDLGQQFNAVSGPAGDFANQLDAINKKYQENVQTARALGLAEAAVAEAEAIRTGQIRQLILAEANLAGVTDSLLGRLNGITGGSTLGGDPFASIRKAIADAIAAYNENPSEQLATLIASLKQELGLDQQFNAYLDGLEQAKQSAAAQQAFDQATNSLLQSQLDVAKQTLSVTQQSVDELQNVVSNLRKFQDSFKLDLSLTTLSPRGQLDEAARQFRALLAQANAGDQTAANGLSASAQQYATIGKSYYGSTSGYVDIYNEIQSGVGGVTDKFGAQLDTQQSILAELQKQTGLASAQLSATQTASMYAQAQALISAATQLPAQTVNGVTVSPINDLLARYPGIYSGDLTPNTNTPANLRAQLRQQFFNSLIWNDILGEYTLPDGTPFTGNVPPGTPGFARGGSFGGGVLRVGSVGESAPELLAVGPTRVHTADQLAAPVVAELRRGFGELSKRLSVIERGNADHSRSVRVAQRVRDN